MVLKHHFELGVCEVSEILEIECVLVAGKLIAELILAHSHEALSTK